MLARPCLAAHIVAVLVIILSLESGLGYWVESLRPHAPCLERTASEIESSGFGTTARPQESESSGVRSRFQNDRNKPRASKRFS